MKIILDGIGFEVLSTSEGLKINGEVLDVIIDDVNEGSFFFIYDKKSYRVSVFQEDEQFNIRINGKRVWAKEVPRLKELMKKIGVKSLASDHVKELKAPMPGKILKVLTQNKDIVERSQGLIVLEAMKMENVLKSPIGGEVAGITVKAGDTVEKDQILVTFEDPK